MTELQFQPVEGEMHVGDIVTMTHKVDTRTWWQRRPRWLGGKPYAPVDVPRSGKVVAQSD